MKKYLLISILFLFACYFSSCSQSVYTGVVQKTERLKSVFSPDQFVLVLKQSDSTVNIFQINEKLYYSIAEGEKVKIWREPVAGAVAKIEILK